MKEKAIFRPYTQEACSLRRSVPGDSLCIDEARSDGRERVERVANILLSALVVVRAESLIVPF